MSTILIGLFESNNQGVSLATIGETPFLFFADNKAYQFLYLFSYNKAFEQRHAFQRIRVSKNTKNVFIRISLTNAKFFNNSFRNTKLKKMKRKEG